MKRPLDFVRIGLLVLVWFFWLWLFDQSFSPSLDLAIIVGGPLLIFPVIWLARKRLDRQPTVARAAWITTYVHYAVGWLLGAAIIRVIVTLAAWPGLTLPIPPGIGLALAIVSGVAFLLTVINLALKGLGAPFAIALSQKLAVDWLYAWTRNPMVLAGLALLLSLGIWFQSWPFLVWTLVVVTPPLLYFVKVYEERELEIRFGTSYLEYKARTPMLFPRKPRN